MKSECQYQEVILEGNTEDNNLVSLSYEQENNFSQHIPYLSFSQTLAVGSSSAEVAIERRKERKRWRPTEDYALINAWLNTSKNVVSNEQGAFWGRIATLYAENPSIADGEKRPPNTCKQRWRKIYDQVSKFCKAYATAKSQIKDGMNDNVDDLKLAHQIFFDDYKVKFNLEYAWNVLKKEQKWWSLAIFRGKGKGKGKGEVASAQSVSSHSVNNVEDDDIIVRPPGFEASKRQKSEIMTPTPVVEEQTKKLENFQTNFQAMWEIKQKNLALKDQILNKKLLENLLAKTEPLSDIEAALKNKLIVDMLSKS